MTQLSLNDEQQEIIDLLTGEIGDICNESLSQLNDASQDNIADTLFETQVQLAHIANALNMAGLSGLAFCAQKLSENLKSYTDTQKQPSTEEIELMGLWGPLFLSYLSTLNQPSDSDVHARDILRLLENTTWPEPLTDTEKHTLSELFNVPLTETLRIEETPALPDTVTEEMCDLQVDENIRPELLQGMLIELPQQVEQFENSLAQFIASKSLEDLNQAQRIAHTIKGAANIVAVTGLANVMHYTEALLEQAEKRWQQAPKGFDIFLQDVADCLAASAEYLNNVGPKPDDIADTLSGLLHWLRRVHSKEDTLHPESGDSENYSNPNTNDITQIAESTPTAQAEQAITEHELNAPTTPEHDKENETAIEDSSPTSTAATHATTNVTTEAQENTSSTIEQSPSTTEEDDNTYYINLPNRIAQELLRLSGETQITNNQFGVQIENLQDSAQLCDRYHKQIQNMAQEFEALVQTQSALRSAAMVSKDNQFDPLEMEQFNELHSFSHQLLELTTDSYESVLSVKDQLHELNGLLYAQQQLNHDSQHILLDINLLPVKTVSSRFSRCVRQACRLTHKAATLVIHGEDVMMDSQVLNAIADPIMHLLRNAVDHGLENSRQERENRGKPAEGRIELSFTHHGEVIVIECKDDGRGLDYDAIYHTALEKELIKADESLAPQLLEQLLLLPGFSTRKTATQTSGRGIGLDAVNDSIRSLKGNMQIASEKGSGCTLTITVPSSILSAHAIIVKSKVGTQYYTHSILGRAVEQIIYVRPEQIQADTHGHHFIYEDAHVPVVALNDFLGLGNGDIKKINALLLYRKNDDSLILVGVENIIASQELVIKPLNKATYVPDGVVGATIMGDGSVSPVLDLLELPGMVMDNEALAQLSRKRAQLSALENASNREPPAALVVDDSLSARRSLAQFVTDLGMDVITAKDGFDAIHAIENKKPTLLLVDLEMPRMNGLELTAHLRSHEEYKDLPVIMITSRSTDRHKSLAKNAGVNTYLTKPWSEDELMRCIEAQIAS